MKNRLLAADSYKYSHYLQSPPRTQYVSSYIEARGVSQDFPDTNEVVHIGTEAFIKEYLFNSIQAWEVNEAEEIAKLHGVPFNREGWDIILKEYNGQLPILIESLPEGMVVPLKTCQAQVINTDARLPWITSFIETALLRAIWYPSTVATLSREVKKICKTYLDKTSDNPDHLDFMLHDFGSRGATSGESAGIGGMGHLVNFKGTDNLEAIGLIRRVYGDTMPGFSIPAAEHSTITSWQNNMGGEEAAYENMINQFGGEGKIYAVVSDSYDIYNAIENIWGGSLKEKVLAKGGRLVIRPDSGNPVDMVLNVINILGVKFGHTINSKGYRVLHPSVRVIQGDGIDIFIIEAILKEMLKQGWASDNVVFGMGGGLLQKVNRDSLKYAMKASAIFVDGSWYDVYKNPVSDLSKGSKKGRLAVTDDFQTLREEQVKENLLEVVFDDPLKGQLYFELPVKDDFETIRKRAVV